MDTGKYLYVVEVHAMQDSDSKLAQYVHGACAEVEALVDINLREAGLKVRAPLMQVASGRTSNLLICSYDGIIHWLPDEESNVPEIIYFVLILRLRHHNQKRLGGRRFCCTVALFYDKQGGGHDFTE